MQLSCDGSAWPRLRQVNRLHVSVRRPPVQVAMNLPTPKSYRTVIGHLSATRPRALRLPDLPWRAPRRYVTMAERLGPQVVDDDYRLVDGKRLREENLQVEYPRARLGEVWMVFAVTRRGDAWVLGLEKSNDCATGFINHAKGTVQELGISVQDWLRVAYFSRECRGVREQVYESNFTDRAMRHVRHELNRLHPRLGRRMPNTFF
jgi:hypothetical protein